MKIDISDENSQKPVLERAEKLWETWSGVGSIPSDDDFFFMTDMHALYMRLHEIFAEDPRKSTRIEQSNLQSVVRARRRR